MSMVDPKEDWPELDVRFEKGYGELVCFVRTLSVGVNCVKRFYIYYCMLYE